MRQGVALFLIVVLLAGCATTSAPTNAQKTKPTNIKEWVAQQSRANRRAVGGAVIFGVLGALSGVAVGASNDEIVRRAVAGAAVGAAIGYAIGKHQDRLYAERDFAIRQLGYDPSQGYVARVEQVSFDPSQPKPGDTATLYVRYVVIGPNPNEAIQVRVFRGLKYGDDYILGAGPNDFSLPKGGGVVESRMEITLPKKATQGTYSLEALVEDAKGRFPQAIGTGSLYIVAQAKARGGARIAS